jgi:hypothetical protein
VSPVFPFRRVSPGAWHVLAQSEVDRIRNELALAVFPPDPDSIIGIAPDDYLDAVKTAASTHLDKAETALQPVGPWRALTDWYSGDAIEQTWLNIHRASELLVMIQSAGSVTAEFVQADAAFRAVVPSTDPRSANLAGALTEITQDLLVKHPPGAFSATLRGKLKAVQGVANVASDTAHATVRHWRNLLLLGGLVLAGFAGAVTIIHAFVPGFFSYSHPGQKGDAIEPWAVALVGSLGGALAAVLALNRFSGFTDPAGLPVVQALLRIPTATVTALIGVLLMQTSTLNVLKPQDGMTVLAYAFFFGYAQEPLMRAIDRQAGAVLNPARSKDEPAKTIPPKPIATASTTPSPTVSVAPASGAATTPFTISGSGFWSGEVVALQLGTASLPAATADGNGSFSQASEVPPLGSGPYIVTAAGQSSARVATAQFTVP